MILFVTGWLLEFKYSNENTQFSLTSSSNIYIHIYTEIIYVMIYRNDLCDGYDINLPKQLLEKYPVSD